MAKRIGSHTIFLQNKPIIAGFGSAVGKKESEGPLASYFDNVFTNTTLGEDTWESAESGLINSAVTTAMKRANVLNSDVNGIFAGDLLDQCIASTFGVKEIEAQHIGLFGACSTMALSLALAGIFVDSGAVKTALAAASSHFCSAERQYRYPLEYGGQRSPASQWTVTGAGAAVVAENQENAPKIEKVIIGSVRDLGITDVNNMGAAMAPAAAQTIGDFLKDTNTKPEDYDLILTGDLGSTGSALLKELMRKEYCTDIGSVHNDCGMMIYDLKAQDMHSGGSGCGCSASVVCSYILDRIKSKELKNVLFVGTGALRSPTSSMQKESIPGIAHGVLLKAE